MSRQGWHQHWTASQAGQHPTVDTHPTRANVRQRMPGNILILADWRLAGLVDDTMPPRDPNGDDDEEEEDEDEDEDEDEERNDQPPVVREPEPDE